MKILIASSYQHAWNSVRPEAEMFIDMVKLGHQVTIMTQGDADYVSRFNQHGVRTIDCYPDKKVSLNTIREMSVELEQGQYDIFYSFNSRTIPNAIFASRGKPVKLVTYRGTTGGLYRHDPSAYLTHLNPRVDGIVCVSDAVRDDVRQHVWRNKENVVRIYKGHQLDWYKVEPTPRETLGLNTSDIVAVCAAHVRPSKGIALLIDACRSITATNFHLLLVGSGFEPYLVDINTHPMADRIHMLGHRNDVPSVMAMADFQVQPSISGEGLPRTIIEAMANGTPSVVTTTGGSPELVDDGKTGFVVAAGDAQAFAQAMNNMLSDRQQLSNFGAAAQAKLATEFSSTETVNQHLAFFESLL